MKRFLKIAVVSVFALTGFNLFSQVYAAETKGLQDLSLTVEPARYAFVKGDVPKFQAHHWIKSGYVGGVREFEAEVELPDDVTLSMEGHALIEENDFQGELKFKKADIWFLNFEYKEFRKYYDTTGGYYNLFSTIKSVDTDKDLRLDIGNFAVEFGLTLKNWPDIIFDYEHEFRKGTKSRLSWGFVAEGTLPAGNAANVKRQISPTWQEIDEEVNKFGIKLSDEAKWFNWHAEQQWEYVRIKTMREEKSVSTTPPAGAFDSNVDQKIRNQFQEPKQDLITTILGGDKWFMGDKVYLSSAYRYSQLTGHELENIYEYDQNRILTNFSNPEQVRDAHSDNLFSTSTWVTSLLANPWKNFSAGTKFKVESTRRDSSSTYPKDNGTSSNNGNVKPNGTIDQIDVSENQNNLMRTGEGLSFRYTGIPRVALFNEYEFEQVKDDLYEDRQSKSTSEIFNRQVISHMFRSNQTLGIRAVPLDSVTLTGEVRHRDDDVRYNNIRYSNVTATGAKSVFIDGQFVETNELAARIALKPCTWFQPSFRLTVQDKSYETWGLPDSDNKQESEFTSNIYSFEVLSTPNPDLILMGTFAVQDARMLTGARLSTTTSRIPTANMDVYLWTLSADYILTKDIAWTGVLQHSSAANFNDYSDIGMPYGSDYEETDVTTGVRWSPKKDLWIEPKYSFFQYRNDPDAEFGGYSAHVLWCEVHLNWN